MRVSTCRVDLDRVPIHSANGHNCSMQDESTKKMSVRKISQNALLTLRRHLSVERLEDRSLLAALWQNAMNRFDVDNSGDVAPIDALIVINHLLENGGSYSLADLPAGSNPPPFVDVNGNDFADPLDVLAVVNFLNNRPMDEPLVVQRFHVDVTTGRVSIGTTNPPSTDGSEGESLFIGSTIAFNSSPLLNQSGDVAKKEINVSLTNHSGELIGMIPNGTQTGLRVLFSDFVNVGTPSDLRTKTTVATFAGSGAASSNDGAGGQQFWYTRNPPGVAQRGWQSRERL